MTETKPQPLYFTVLDVSRILGWSKQRTFRWLKRSKALLWRGGWVTTARLLRESFPEVYDQITIHNWDIDDDGIDY